MRLRRVSTDDACAEQRRLESLEMFPMDARRAFLRASCPPQAETMARELQRPLLRSERCVQRGRKGGNEGRRDKQGTHKRYETAQRSTRRLAAWPVLLPDKGKRTGGGATRSSRTRSMSDSVPLDADFKKGRRKEGREVGRVESSCRRHARDVGPPAGSLTSG